MQLDWPGFTFAVNQRNHKCLIFSDIMRFFLVISFCYIIESDCHRTADIKDQYSASETKNNTFLFQLFNKYGANGIMHFEGFEHLLGSLGLANIHIHDHSIEDHTRNNSFASFHISHTHSHDRVDESFHNFTSIKRLNMKNYSSPTIQSENHDSFTSGPNTSEQSRVQRMIPDNKKTKRNTEEIESQVGLPIS